MVIRMVKHVDELACALACAVIHCIALNWWGMYLQSAALLGLAPVGGLVGRY